MNKENFLRELATALSPLPTEEKEHALEYYAELIEESGNDTLFIASLPKPKQIASKLIIEFGTSSKEKGSSLSLTTIILAICSAPITLPLAVAALAILLALAIVVFCAVIIVPLSLFLSFIVTAVASILAIIPAFLHNLATGLFFLGISLASLSLVFLCCKVWKALAQKTFNGMKLFLLRFAKKRTT